MLMSRLFRGILSAILLGNVEALSSTARFSNSSTITTAPSSLASACCFAVQDTVSEVYWNIYTTHTTYSIVNLTSITTFVTPYPTTTISNIETNIYTTNASFLFSNNIGRNPVTLYSNPGGVPAQTSTALNGTQTITAGVTVASPAAFWVYSTLKIITVPQVTNSNGDYVCATVSTSTSIETGRSFSRFSYPTSTQTRTSTITETLYTSIGSGYVSATGTTTRTETSYYTYYGYSVSTGGAFTSTEPDVYSFTVNSYANAYFGGSATTKPSGTVLTLATPYIYLPARGSAGLNGTDANGCNRSPGQENFGYPVQAAIDFAASQYPQIASCLPGGPSVLPATECSAVSPETEDAGGDLTSSTVITVQPSSTAVPTTSIPTAQPITQSTSASPGTTATQPVPETSSTPASTPASEPVSVPSSAPETQPATSNPPTSTSTSVNPPQPASTASAPETVVNPTSPATEPSTIVGPPVSASSASTQAGNGASSVASVVPSQGQASTNVPASNSPGQTQASVVQGSSSTTEGALGSIIASMVGGGTQAASASTTISGVPNVIISTATTVPLSQGAPSISGLTTVISGTTNVIVSLATTIPATKATQALPGSETVVSGTTNVVLGASGTTSIPVNSLLPGLTGSTTVVPGTSGGAASTYVIVTGPTTVPVVSSTRSGSGSSSTAGGTSAPLQVSAGIRSESERVWSTMLICFGIAFALMV